MYTINFIHLIIGSIVINNNVSLLYFEHYLEVVILSSL